MRGLANLTASVLVLRPMIAYARTTGVDIDHVLRSIGVDPATIDDSDRRIPESYRARAWLEAAKCSRDPSFALHVPENAKMGAYDVLDYSLYFSSTLDEALDHMLRFHRILCDAWAFERVVIGAAVHFRRVVQTPAPEEDAAFAFLVVRARQLTGVDVVPREVKFAHPAPSDRSAHDALFHCPVRFDCPASEIAFEKKDLELPVHSANAGVNRILERYMTQLLSELPKNDSFVEHARVAIRRTLRNGRPRVQTTARAMHASVRTVQRKLGEHGTSHSEVVDSVRRELAERLLANGRLSMTEVAFTLGFADVGGFRRVYKRWTGKTPSRARAPT